MIEQLLIAAALAMDCLTVSVVAGIIVRRRKASVMLRMAFLFGFFQALMPLAGWFLTSRFSSLIEAYDHWIAFGLLLIIGSKMIADSLRGEQTGIFNPYGLGSQLMLAVATSIDALAIGISFACTGYDTLTSLGTPLLVIGAVSFVFSLLGSELGIRFGEPVRERIRPEILGGIILICIGVKILLEHLAIL
ncbi:MAG: manganese efflux pump [Bacteroidales bacterium]|nr:manganese efflux pump [Bacteroidales bacterium]